ERMTTALLVSSVALWITAVTLAGVGVARLRQIGVLYERVAPAGAPVLGHGPGVGDAAPALVVEMLDGRTREIGGARADGHGTLLFFVSPTCPVCKELLPLLPAIAREERVEVVLASDGPRAEHERFVAREGIERFAYVLSAPLGIAYQVSKLPYAVLIDGAGIVRAKGLVNTREHLESLFEAQAKRVASIQDFLAAEREPTEGVQA